MLLSLKRLMDYRPPSFRLSEFRPTCDPINRAMREVQKHINNDSTLSSHNTKEEFVANLCEAIEMTLLA